ncbi:hypothetical protein TNCV_1220931 [Trichonephila clavipes]|nr:hypothetical protein TNCV_1220931 [Trichonephila clavipes]
MAGKAVSLHSLLANRNGKIYRQNFEADVFSEWCGRPLKRLAREFSGLLLPLTSARKTLQSGSALATRGHSSVALRSSHSDNCITRLTPSGVRFLDVPLAPWAESLQDANSTGLLLQDRFQQDYDAPDIISGCTPLHHGQNAYKIQTAPGYYYKTDELLRCFNKITTLQTFFFSPIRTWTAVRDQESVNQESVNQESVNQESVTRSPSTDSMAGKAVSLHSLLANRNGKIYRQNFEADVFSEWCGRPLKRLAREFSGLLLPLTSARKTLQSGSALATRGHSSVALRSSHSDK